MPVDLALLLEVITTALVVLGVVASALRRLGVFRTIERLWREHTTVKVVREQRRMATLRLPPGTELTHSLHDGPRLVIRTRTSHQNALKGEEDE